jgi:hypothetical protein
MEKNRTTGTGDSGAILLHTGDTQGSGRTGNILLFSGDSSNGNSGDIHLYSGAAPNGTRGNIIINAPLIQSPNVTGSDNSPELHLTSGTVVDGISGDAGIESGGATGTGSSGTAYLGSSDAGGNTGLVWIYTGSSSGGNSGDIHIEVGGADGTRGNVIVSANTITSASGDAYLQIQSADQSVAATPSADVYVFTGVPGNNAASGAMNVGTGNNTGIGNTGDAYLYSGNANDGNSGSVFLQTGTATGTRGRIILDAPLVMSPTNTWINLQGGSGGAWLFSADITDPEDTTASGNAGVGSGNAAGSGPSGEVAVYTGDAAANSGLIGISTGTANNGNSGNIGIATGNATGGVSGDIALTTGTTYTAKAVHFYEGVTLTSESGFGTPSVFSFSFWFNMPSYDGSPHNQDFSFFKVANHDASDYGAIGFTGTDDWTSPGLFNSYWPDPTDASYLNFGAVAASTDLYNGQWHHVLGTVSGALGLTTIYIDDQLLGLPTYIVGNNWTPPLDLDWQGSMTISAQPGSGQEFDIADLWIAPGVSLLNGGGTIDVATRRQFITASGQPMNPTGFPSAAVLFSGNSTTFATNQGTGSSFVASESLTDATTSPSHGRGKIILDAPKISLPGLTPFPIANSVPPDSEFLLNTSDRSWTLSTRDLAVALLNQSIQPPPLDANDDTGTRAQDVYLLAGGGTDAQPTPGNISLYAGSGASSATGGVVNIASGYSNPGGTTGNVSIYSATAGNGGSSGTIYLYSGDIFAGDGTSGAINISSGRTPGAGNTGTIALLTGQCTDTGSSGQITLTTGDVTDAAAFTGNITLQGGTGANGSGGTVLVYGGARSSDTFTGSIQMFGGNALNGQDTINGGKVTISGGSGGDQSFGGDIILTAGYTPLQNPPALILWGTGGATMYGGNGGTGTNRKGGDVSISGSNGDGSGDGGTVHIFAGVPGETGTAGDVVIALAGGNVKITGLPTSNPHVVDALWIDTTADRVLKVSAG